MFADPLEHLQAELRRLDLLLHREILRLRAAYQLSLDEFQGLYIGDEHVDHLVQEAARGEDAAPDVEVLTEQAEAMREWNIAHLDEDWPWARLVPEFGLSPFEADVLLLAVAPELDLKYERLFAYLNNDITRKWPTYDLALRLFCGDASQRARQRACLLPGATLFASGLLQPIQVSSERPAWLAGGFCAAPVVSHHLLSLSPEDPRLAAYVVSHPPTTTWEDVPLSADMHAHLRQITKLFRNRSGPMLVFEGRQGAGRSLAAQAICADLGIPLLRLGLATLRAGAEMPVRIGQALVLHARLLRAGVYLENGEVAFGGEGMPLPDIRELVRLVAQLHGPVFFACALDTPWHKMMQGERHLAFSFTDPDYSERRRLWATYTAQVGCAVPERAVEVLANRFVLNPGQIREAVVAAKDSRDLRDGLEGALRYETLLEAVRIQSDQSLGRLAVKVRLLHTWADLVLPPATLRRAQQVTAAIKNHYIVYSQWGFERRIASGKGTKVLFSGASGTGKTMTASVIARDLDLDLYKIDLSGLVSKYIGETEKNLDRIFRAAQCSNAILFFDEADALFGKRSEVKDAHDRYANIEVAYLLQKMEEYEGAVILASNLSKNIDEAFSRRMHYVLEFPLPDEAHRLRLWRGMFPALAPLGEDVDFGFLARQFPISGGDLQNVALEAAFLAAQDGHVIQMAHLIQAMARQTLKQGKVPSPADFKQYHGLMMQGA